MSSAINDLFGDLLTTSYSTKKELDGGIKPGEEWFRWIVERVREANIAVILLTPASVQKPWVLWEAGAVYGAGFASADATARKVRPLVFKLTGSQVPSPFAGIQAVAGDERSGIERFLRDLIDTFRPLMDSADLFRAGERLSPTIATYLERVEKALRDAPLFPTEAAIAEWCERLDKLTAANRQSEVAHLHDWLNVTFGRSRGERPMPLDLRLHRRLGFAYRAAKRPDRSVLEFELALEFAPRDIYLLRELGIAYLDGNRLDEASRVIDRIAELDKDAFSHNVECAALKARHQRESKNLDGAVETYRRALEHNADSYYLADVLGQTLLSVGKLDEARQAYRRASERIDELGERNVWTHATQASACLVLGDEPQALHHLMEIAALRPTLDEIERIEGGLEQVHRALGTDDTARRRCRDALRGQE
jgi:tetratricopeptide (TPR) repeat protein